jgi:hypothetical protein
MNRPKLIFNIWPLGSHISLHGTTYEAVASCAMTWLGGWRVPGGRRDATLVWVLPTSLARLSHVTWHGMTSVQVSSCRMSTSYSKRRDSVTLVGLTRLVETWTSVWPLFPLSHAPGDPPPPPLLSSLPALLQVRPLPSPKVVPLF